MSTAEDRALSLGATMIKWAIALVGASILLDFGLQVFYDFGGQLKMPQLIGLMTVMYLLLAVLMSGAALIAFVVLFGRSASTRRSEWTTRQHAMTSPLSPSELLIGSWTFVSAFDTHADGEKKEHFSPNTKGLVIFDPIGQFSLVISRVAKNSHTARSETGISCFGTWAIEKKVLTLKIEVASPPKIAGTYPWSITLLDMEQLGYKDSEEKTCTEFLWRRAEH